MGWNVRLSSIQVETRFGVPRYTGDEIYLLDGAVLTPVAGTDGAPGANPRRYQRRVEGAFDRIERFGDSSHQLLLGRHRQERVQEHLRSLSAARADASVHRQTARRDGRSSRSALGGRQRQHRGVVPRALEDPSGNRMSMRYFRDVWDRGEQVRSAVSSEHGVHVALQRLLPGIWPRPIASNLCSHDSQWRLLQRPDVDIAGHLRLSRRRFATCWATSTSS